MKIKKLYRPGSMQRAWTALYSAIALKGCNSLGFAQRALEYLLQLSNRIYQRVWPTKYAKVLSVDNAGYEDVFDITVRDTHCFYANNILVHNCHRTSAKQISTNISKIRSPVKIFGMTATPTGRSDGSELAVEALVGPVIYRISYQEAAENGLVSNLKVLMIDLNDCAPSSGNYKSKVAKQRNCYWRNVKRNQLIAAAIKEMPKLPSLPDDPQMLILTATIDHAFRIRQYLPDFEVVYASMGKDKLEDLKNAGIVEDSYVALTAKKRDELLKGFEQGTVRRAIATGCWGEGVDFVHLDVLAIAAGQYSSIDTEQWAGRNSRIYEGKQHGIVIDMMDQWDPWTASRAKQRMRVYKSKGWEIEKFDKYLERAYNELPLQEINNA